MFRNLKVLVQRDPEAQHIWVAQTLQGDIVGQGSTMREAIQDLRGALLTFFFRKPS